ncbi:MAG: hypothetical protein AAFY15_12880, partial [Cyanobacteria bacterium J06648_11]
SLQSIPIIALVAGRTGDWRFSGHANVAAVISKLANPLLLPMAIARALQWPAPHQQRDRPRNDS